MQVFLFSATEIRSLHGAHVQTAECAPSSHFVRYNGELSITNEHIVSIQLINSGSTYATIPYTDLVSPLMASTPHESGLNSRSMPQLFVVCKSVLCFGFLLLSW
jgi:hypothetical protein